MRSPARPVLSALSAVALLALAGCAADTASSAPAPAATAPATPEATTIDAPASPAALPSGDSVKVGILQSLSGTMAISEVTVKNAELLAIDQINAKGGILGKQIQPVIEDGAS